MSATPVIATRGLCKDYGEKRAVDDLDLDIMPGEIFGLLGPNGAGKTTTILMMLGLTEPTEGTVEVLGLDPRHEALQIKASVGYLPDAVGFYEQMTGRENLRYTARLNRMPRDQIEDRITEVLELVGLADAADQRTGSYSRGMLQRLGLGDALIARPSVLILDEPTVNIDPAGVTELLELVRKLADDGVAVLLSSHLLHQVQEICDRIGIFVAGRLVAIGSIAELAENLDEHILVEVEATGETGEITRVLEGVEGVSSVTYSDKRWFVAADRDVRSDVVDGLRGGGHELLHLRRESVGLDAIYQRYFQSAGEKGDD
jgi:ABC-2 type transport system ATP-binding protein